MVYTPSMRDEAVRAKTGRDWQQWFAVMDGWGAKTAGHAATARWLQEEHGVSGWWAQGITVEYERARGLRKVGQLTSGDFAVNAQRTVALDLEAAVAAFVDGRKRRRWVDDEGLHAALAAGMRQRRETDGGRVFDKIVRCPLHLDDQGRLELSFTAKADKTVVRLQHTGLTSDEQRAALKMRWATQLDRLRDLSP